MSAATIDRVDLAKRMLSKVPEVTIYFWIIKVLCTTVGETAADFLNINLGLGLTVTTIVMSVLLAGALFVRRRKRGTLGRVSGIMPEGVETVVSESGRSAWRRGTALEPDDPKSVDRVRACRVGRPRLPC